MHTVEKRRDDHEEYASPRTSLLPDNVHSVVAPLAQCTFRRLTLYRACHARRVMQNTKRHSAGLAHAENLRDLADRLDELEMGVEMACVTAANLRQSTAPLLKARALLRPWAAARGVDTNKSPPLLRTSMAPPSLREASEGDKSNITSPAMEGECQGPITKGLRFSEEASNRPSTSDDRRAKGLARIQEERRLSSESSTVMVNSRKSAFMLDDHARKTASERAQARTADANDFELGGVSHVMA